MRSVPRSLLLAWIPLGVWFGHGLLHLVWFNIDHGSAFWWMDQVGFVTITHCFGPGGFWDHLLEVESAGVPLAAVAGLVGTVASLLTLRQPMPLELRGLGALGLLANLMLLVPPTLYLLLYLRVV